MNISAQEIEDRRLRIERELTFHLAEAINAVIADYPDCAGYTLLAAMHDVIVEMDERKLVGITSLIDVLTESASAASCQLQPPHDAAENEGRE